MSHTSDLPAILSNVVGKLISEKGPEASWELVKTQPNEFPTGSTFKYNQTSYIIVSKIIEKVTNKTFVDIIRENQLQKDAMKRTEYAGFENLNNVVTTLLGAITIILSDNFPISEQRNIYPYFIQLLA